MRPSLFACTVLCLAALVLAPGPSYGASPAVIPNVHFTIFRFNGDTQQFIGLYELTQPYRKSLPQAGFTQSTNLLYAFNWGGDFGDLDVQSRLTGQRILQAGVVWMGMGTFMYPTSGMSTTLLHGYTNAPPQAVINPGIGDPVDANAAWALAQDTDAISRLAAFGTYEVYVIKHHYGDGGSPPNPEIFVIAAGRPVAPDDMAVLQVVWPRTLVTAGLPVTPEIIVHNFSDSPKSLQLRVTTTGDPLNYQATQPIGFLAADESRTVILPSMPVSGAGSRTLSVSFRTGGGGTWTDSYPTNDTAAQSIDVTDQPVFRSSQAFPWRGLPCDFDDDGDLDFVSYEQYLHLYQNDGSEHFTDVTGLTPLPSRSWPRFAVCADFNRDGHADIFLSYWAQGGLMLAGTGGGAFTDVTTAWGLAGITTYADMIAIDKEKDGDLDLFITAQGQEPVLENDGSGHFTNVTALSGLTDSGQTEKMTSGDLNKDGYPDIAMANWGRDATVFINDGDGTFTKLNRGWSMTYERDVVLFDFDGDHDDDIFFLANSGVSILYRNDGNLYFEGQPAPAGGFPVGGLGVDAGDFNKDGRPDLAFSNGKLLQNTGGAFQNATALLVEQTGGLGSDIRFVDLDGDDDLDIYASEARAFMNQGVVVTPTGATPRASVNALEQNFPNPFNPQTTIRYRVAAGGRVTLAVYNVAGQLVRTLVNETQPASGAARVTVWDGRDNRGQRVASGVYLYRMTSPGFTQTRKLVLLK